MLQFPLPPEVAARVLLAYKRRVLGGSGSGNFGHAGRPGEVGGSSVKLYRGDAKSLNPSLSYSDPGALFGAGIYLTDNKRIAGDYTSKGAQEGVLFRYGGSSKTTKQDAIDSYIRQQAQFFDAKGQPLTYPQSLSGYSYEKGVNVSAAWKKMADEDTKRIGYAEKEWEANKSLYEIRKQADNTITIRQKGETGHVAHYEIPKTWIDNTLNAEDPIPEKVAGALHDAIHKESPGLAREVYDFARSKNEDGERPTFREVYQRSHEAMMNGIDNEASQLKMRQSLKELGYKGIRYAGGVTMGGARHTAYVFWDEQGLKKVRVLGSAASGNYGHKGRPGEVGGSGKGNVTSYDDSGVSQDVIDSVLGSGVDVRHLAEGMVKYADENFRIEVTTTGGGPDEYQLQEEYDQYVAREQASEARVYAEEQGQRQREIAQIWRETEQETLAVDPYGDVSKHPALPGFELTGGRPSEPRVSYEELTAGTDTSAPFNEEERQTIRERLQGTGGPLPLSRSELINQYLETHQDFEGQSFREWVNDRSDGGASDEVSVEISFNGDKGAIITRVFTQTDAGLTVDHHYFQVPKARQSGGLAKDVFRGSVEEYEKIGVDRIDVQANIDRGAYAWARYGFKPNDPEEVNSNLLRWAEYKVSPAARDAIRHAVDNGDSDTAIWRVVDTVLDGEKIAKPLLLDEQWFGHFNFSDAEAKARLKKYITRPTPKISSPTVVVPTVTLKTAAANRGGTELFYVDENGVKGDAEIWAVLLDEPDLLDDDLKSLGSAASGNYGHVGRPGEVGGSGPDTGPHSTPELEAQAQAGIAAVEKLLPEAIKTAEFERHTPETWDELSQEDQNKAYDAWAQSAEENLMNNSDGSVYNEVKKEQVDEIHQDTAFEERVYAKVDEQLAAQGLKLGEEEFSTSETIPDHYAESETGHPTLDTAGLKHADGTPLTEAEQKTAGDTWDGTYESMFQGELETRMNDQVDHINELESEGISQQLSDEWGNMSESEKMQIALNNVSDGFESSGGLDPGAPNKWVTGIDGERTSEDYQRTHAVANQLTILRTDEIRAERGLLKEPETRVEDRSTPGHPNFVVYDGDKSVGAANTKEQAEANAENYRKNFATQDAAELIDSTWSDWKISSSGQTALALQLATARELGGVHRLTDAEVKNIDEGIGARGMQDMQAYARAQWEVTQYVMSQAGQNEVKVYRALMLPGADVKALNIAMFDSRGDFVPALVPNNKTAYTGPVFEKLTDLQLQRAGAQSTSGTLSVVNSWHGVGTLPPDPKRVVLRIHAPRTSVLSLPVYGANTQEEHEVVLAGAKDKWSWDVWLQKAPAFNTVPVTPALKAAARMLVARMVLDLQALDRGQPHWLLGMTPIEVLTRLEKQGRMLAFNPSQPRDKDGKWSEVPVAPGTSPLPAGHIRAYHYTGDLKSVLAQGLDVQRARGSSYGEPNQIWMSTVKPKDFKDYVEVHVTPEEMTLGRPDMMVKGEDGTYHHAVSDAEKQAAIDEYNQGQHDFTLSATSVPPERFVTHATEWHHHYRYIAENYPPAHPETWGSPEKDVLQMLAGAARAGGVYVPAIERWHAEYKRAKKLKTAGGAGSGNRGHLGRPGEIGGSGPSLSGLLRTIHEAGGGFTYNIITQKQPKDGYMVASSKATELVLDVRGVTGIKLAQYVKDNREKLSLQGNYLGAWHNPKNGKIYLDVTTRVRTHAKAESLGRQGRQIAYYDVARGKEVRIQYGKHRRAEGFIDGRGLRGRGADPRRFDRVDGTVDWQDPDARRNRQDAEDPLGVSPRTLAQRLRALFSPSTYLRDAGGAGSGNYGHAGRPGAVGGSAHSTPLGREVSAKTWLHGGQLSGEVRDPLFLTTNEVAAQWYATEHGGGGGDVVHLRVEVKNPFVIEDYNDAAKLKTILDDAGLHAELTGDPEGWLWHMTPGENSPYEGDNPLDVVYHPEARAALKRAGYDAVFTRYDEINQSSVEALIPLDAAAQIKIKTLGGSGSGNFGHVGRPGEVGGSVSDLTRAKQHVDSTRATLQAVQQKLIAEGKITADSSISDVLALKHPEYDAAYQAFVQANRDVGKAERAVDTGSASERYNRDLHEEHRIQKLVSEAETSRNTTVAKLRESHYTPERSVADIEKLVYTDPEYLKAEQALKDIAGQWTDARLALTASESAMKVEKVTHRAEAIANQLGVDPSIIHVVDKDPTPFIVGSQQFKEAGHYNPADGQIEINARNAYDDRMSVTNGLIAHEVFHHQFHEIQKAVESEHEILKEMRDSADPEFTRLFSGYEYDHTPRPDMLAELRERFPASAAWADTWGDVFLSSSKGWRENQQRMVNEDGHSAYARAYWTGEAIRQRGSYTSAINETLAEVNRWLTSPAAWQESGNPQPKSPWVKLNQDIRNGYKTLKERKLIGAAFNESEHPRDEHGKFSGPSFKPDSVGAQHRHLYVKGYGHARTGYGFQKHDAGRKGSPTYKAYRLGYDHGNDDSYGA